MPEISVIVPVYNASNYLRDTLKSYIGQTFIDIEIILINDGSTDNSIDIIREFEFGDSRILVVDGENRGVSEARNTGIEMAKGRYISFLDADDIADETLLEKLYYQINSEKSDLAICGYSVVEMRGEVNKINIGQINTINLRTRDELISLIKGYIPGNGKDSYALWNKLFKKELIDKYNIRFKSHKHLYFDDTVFCYEYLLYVKSVCYVEESLYTYIRRPFSITTSYVNDSLIRFKNCCDYLTEILQKNKLYDECKESISFLAFALIIRMIYKEINLERPFIEKYKNIKCIIIDTDFRKFIKSINLSDLSIKRKLIYILYKFKLTFVVFISFWVFINNRD